LATLRHFSHDLPTFSTAILPCNSSTLYEVDLTLECESLHRRSLHKCVKYVRRWSVATPGTPAARIINDGDLNEHYRQENRAAVSAWIAAVASILRQKRLIAAGISSANVVHLEQLPPRLPGLTDSGAMRSCRRFLWDALAPLEHQ
jgi:hypothetical protein